MRTRIISAFPGMGKTYFFKNSKYLCLDLDSSLFSWTYIDNVKQRNSNFPENYISHIKENIGKYEFILVSSHKEVRDALIKENLFFYLVYPLLDRKDEFIGKYKQRNDSEDFINLVTSNWETWIREFYYEEKGCNKFSTSCTLSHVIDLIIRNDF